MAMAGGTSVLVYTGYGDNGNQNYPLNLYVYYKTKEDDDENTSTVSVGMYVTTPSSSYYIGSWGDRYGSYVGTTSLTFDGHIGLISGTHWLAENKTYTVHHNSDGSGTATIEWQWGVNSSWGRMQKPNGAFTIQLPKINRLSVASMSTGNLGTQQTITITRPNEDCIHVVSYKTGIYGNRTTIATDVATSCSWTPPLSLALLSPAGTSVNLILECETHSISTGRLIGWTTTSITQNIPSSVAPTASVALSDPLGYASTYGGFVQLRSQLSVLTTASSQYGATIAGYSGTVTKGSDILFTFSEDEYESDIITVSGALNVNVTVTDTRGRTATATGTVNVLPYSAPTASALSVQRCQEDGTPKEDGEWCLTTFSASITPLGNLNTASYVVNYRENGTQQWTSISVTSEIGNYNPTGVSVIFPASDNKSYEVCLESTDSFESLTSSIKNLGVAQVLLQVTADGTGISLGRAATESDTIDIDKNVILRRNAYTKTSLSPTYAGATYTASDCWAIKRIDGSVDLQIVMQLASAPTLTPTLLTLPTGLIPVTRTVGLMLYTVSYGVGVATVNTDGTLTVTGAGNGAAIVRISYQA